MQLFIDTTSDFLFYIIRNSQSQILKHGSLNHHRRHTSETLPALNEALKSCGFALRDITKLFLISGPGLYTSTRVGIVFAKSLALVNPNLQIFILNSLHFQSGSQKAISIIPANRSSVYLGIYNQGVEIVPPQIIPYDILDDFTEPFIKQDYVVLNKYNAIDYCANFNALFKHFFQVMNIDELEPFYIKTVV